MNAACPSQWACCAEPRPLTQAGPAENRTTVRVGMRRRTAYADIDVESHHGRVGTSLWLSRAGGLLVDDDTGELVVAVTEEGLYGSLNGRTSA